MSDAAGDGFQPLGAHFLSYRQSDGTAVTDEIMWRLRAAGVPVWRDASDLPPGDTAERLVQALEGGLAGGLLVITEDLAHSSVVRDIEAPRLITLAEQTEFGLAIANTVLDEHGQVDHGAPDRLLQRTDGKLRGVLQYAVGDPAEVHKLIEGVRNLRMTNARAQVAAGGGRARIDVQTRNHGAAADRSGAELDIRIKPSTGGPLPNIEGLWYFADAAPGLPGALTRAGARHVVITGGAHLSVALALGTLLPAARIGRMEVVDQYDQRWAAGSEYHPAVRDDLLTAVDARELDRDGPVCLYLDLRDEPSDAAYNTFVREHESDFAAFVHVRPTSAGGLDPARAGDLAVRCARFARLLSGSHANADLHLLYRGPFGLAVLVGRLLNTVRTVAYEWDPSAQGRPRFVPALRCVPSDTTRPVQVLLTL